MKKNKNETHFIYGKKNDRIVLRSVIAKKANTINNYQPVANDISIDITICGYCQKINISLKKVNETFSEAYPNL